MLSKTAEYALQAVVCIVKESGGRGLSTEVIAKCTGIPPSYLVKVLGLLARSGIVQSRRGLHGGYTLAALAGDLTFLDVVNAVDPIRRPRICPLGPEASSAKRCPVRKAIDRAAAAVEHELATVKIAGIVRRANTKTVSKRL